MYILIIIEKRHQKTKKTEISESRYKSREKFLFF